MSLKTTFKLQNSIIFNFIVNYLTFSADISNKMTTFAQNLFDKGKF